MKSSAAISARASAAASVKDLYGRSNKAIFSVTRGEMLKDSLGDERRSLVLFTVDHIIVVGAGPVIIQFSHLLDVQVAIGACQVRVVTMNVLIRGNGGCGGHDEESCNGICCFGVLVVALEEAMLWAVVAMEQVAVRRYWCNGSLLLWEYVLRRVKVKHLSKLLGL